MPVGLYTLKDIIAAIVKDRAASSAGDKTKQKQDLLAVWLAYNAWVLDQLLHRRGAEAPNFGNFAWEFFSKPPVAGASDECFAMSCRPIFVLADPFKRVNNLPKKKLVSAPPTLSPSEMINFHKIALRYSKSLTKDAIFTGFRDIVRKIGEVVAANKRVKIQFKIGTMYASEKIVSFEFDLDTLKLDSNSASQVVFTMEKPEVFKEGEERRRQEEEEERARKEREERPASPPLSDDGYTETDPSYMMEDDTETPSSVSASQSTHGPFMVQEQRMKTYVQELEGDAVAEDYLNKTIVTLQREKDRLWDEKIARKKKAAKELQEEILGTIEVRKVSKKEEIVARKVKTETSFYPKTDREGGVLAADETASNLGAHADTYGVPVSRKFKGMKEVSKKGLGYRVSAGELLESLRMQMDVKDVKQREERAMRLEEEKRYIDHINMELDYEQHAKMMEAHKKKDSMLQAWERERFLKEMKKLRQAGDIEGLRSHKISMNQFEENSARSSFAGSGVGFDARK